MPFELLCHPDTPSGAATGIQISVHRGTPEKLVLTVWLSGDTDHIRFPPATTPSRGVELWKHTCVELFVRAAGDAYCEFNFSTSQQWAAYAFDGYRAGMRDIDPVSISGLGGRHEPGLFGGHALVDLTGLPGLELDKPLLIGLSAVVEENNGRKSYWALAHAPGKPDFHHPAAFAQELSTVVYW